MVKRRWFLNLAITATVTIASTLAASVSVAQGPPAGKPARVEIKLGPALESARADLAIIRWITNNPGGTDDRFAVVYFGTQPTDLKQMAKSHIRLNRQHAETVFRVRVPGLKPETTYYYKVTSMESNGMFDPVQSSINQFTTPGAGGSITGPGQWTSSGHDR